MARPRFSQKSKKGGKKDDKNSDKKNPSPKTVEKSGRMKRTGFMDMPPEILLMVYKSIEDQVDKLALVKACSPSILDEEWQTHGIAHLENQMATITDDSQLIRFYELPRLLDEDNFPACHKPPVSREHIAMYTLRSSVLWPRVLHGVIEDIGAEDTELILRAGWFFRPFEHAGDSWRGHLRGWLERVLLQEVCGSRRPSRERLEKVLWGRRWEAGVRKHGGFIAINMNVEDVGEVISKPAAGRRHERLFLGVDELIPLLRNILLMWCSATRKKGSWDEVDVVPMVRDFDGDFWQTGELFVNTLRLGKDMKPRGETKAVIERLKSVTHAEVLTELAEKGVHGYGEE